VLVQTLQTVLNDAYDYSFIPIQKSKYIEGLQFLNSLKGSGYNYMALPFTILPSFLKKISLSCNVDEVETTPHKRVFCSQMALMLLNKCCLNFKHTMNSSCCTPSDLKNIITEMETSVACSPDVFCICDNE
jgi:hypothetical protein